MKLQLLPLLFISAFASAQAHNLPYQKQAPVIDGKLDEHQWRNAAKVNLGFENYPGEGIAAEIKTQGFLFYDHEHLYVAIKALDSEPQNIRANLSDRDKTDRDDTVALVIDTFNDGRNAYEFRVNPMGVQFDARVNDDNGWSVDRTWDGIWHSEAQIDDDGWTVEMKIPLRNLRFADGKGQKTWRFALLRNRPRDVNTELASYRHDNKVKCTLCQFDTFEGFSGVKAGSHWQLTPTLTLARGDSRPDLSQPWQNGDIDNELGLDLRWGLSSDLVVNATINPDFSQVEADAPQLDVNNRFSLFVREKRPFFLDGADVFNTRGLTLVHTRNIDSPDFGIKATGKSDGNTYGVLLANDDKTAFLLPGKQGSAIYRSQEASQVAIGRFKTDIGERSTIGVLTTARKGEDYSNYLASIDGTYSINTENSVQYQWAYSDTENPLAIAQDYGLVSDQRDSAFSVDYYHDTRDYNLNMGYRTVGKDFRADMGFVNQSDVSTWSVGGRRTYYGEKGDTFTRFGYFGNVYLNESTDGQALSEYYDFRGFANGPMQFFANFGYSGGSDEYAGQTFKHNRLVTYSTITPYSGVELQLFVGYGKQIDWVNVRPATRLDLQATINWQPTKHLSVFLDHTIESLKERYGYERNNVRFGKDTVYTAHQTDLRLSYLFDVKSQLQFTLQYTDIDRNEAMYGVNFDDNPDNDFTRTNRFFSSKLLYSYKVNPQTLVYLGYADGGLQANQMDSISRNTRSFFAKFSYAWQL